jgi:hypothetical protein
LEIAVIQVINRNDTYAVPMTELHKTVHEGMMGTLYVTQSALLLGFLQQLKIPNLGLPRNESALGRRLRSEKFKHVKVLDYKNAPDIEALRPVFRVRPLGLFVAESEAVIGVTAG